MERLIILFRKLHQLKISNEEYACMKTINFLNQGNNKVSSVLTFCHRDLPRLTVMVSAPQISEDCPTSPSLSSWINATGVCVRTTSSPSTHCSLNASLRSWCACRTSAASQVRPQRTDFRNALRYSYVSLFELQKCDTIQCVVPHRFIFGHESQKVCVSVCALTTCAVPRPLQCLVFGEKHWNYKNRCKILCLMNYLLNYLS